MKKTYLPWVGVAVLLNLAGKCDPNTTPPKECVDDDDCCSHGAAYLCEGGRCTFNVFVAQDSRVLSARQEICGAGGPDPCVGGEGCQCYANETCDLGLSCEADECVAEVRCMGGRGCDCYPNQTCNSGLTCRSGQCVTVTPSDGGVASEAGSQDAGCTGAGCQCDGFAVGVQTDTTASLACGVPGPITLNLFAPINAFWGSLMTPCACDSQSLCNGNAVVLQQDKGIIYYDRALLESLAAQAGGDVSPAAWLMAHEAGHNVQLQTGLGSLGTKSSELSADCLAGYYVGWHVCRGSANALNVANALMAACRIGDPIATPWFAPGAHGTCAERVAAVKLGMEGYASNRRPSVVCAYSTFGG